MEDNQINDNQRNNKYLFKLFYLIRINLPTNEFLYAIMFFFKYLGLILFSISLNELKININDNSNSEISYNFIYQFFIRLMINGRDLKILIHHYQEICLIGFYILIIFIIFIFLGTFYMKKKYYTENSSSLIDSKIKKIYFYFKI